MELEDKTKHSVNIQETLRQRAIAYEKDRIETYLRLQNKVVAFGLNMKVRSSEVKKEGK